eukprot:gene16232-21511_t
MPDCAPEAGVVELVTPRLRLRRAHPDDLEALFGILSDPEAMRYWSTPPHSDLEMTRLWLASMIDGSSGGDFIIELDGQCIGKVGCWQWPE